MAGFPPKLLVLLSLLLLYVYGRRKYQHLSDRSPVKHCKSQILYFNVFTEMLFVYHVFHLLYRQYLPFARVNWCSITAHTCNLKWFCLCSWAENRTCWKFQKTRQTWLLQHMFNSEKVRWLFYEKGDPLSILHSKCYDTPWTLLWNKAKMTVVFKTYSYIIYFASVSPNWSKFHYQCVCTELHSKKICTHVQLL